MHRGRNLPEPVRHQVHGAHKEQVLRVLPPGQVEDVDADGHHGADDGIGQVPQGLLHRGIDIGKGHDGAHQHDGHQGRQLGLLDDHGAVDRQDDEQRHDPINRHPEGAQLRKQLHQQQEPQRPHGAQHGAEDAVQGEGFRILQKRLHTDDGRDDGGAHVAPAAPEHIDHQTDEHRRCRFDDPLPQRGQDSFV